MRLVSLFLVSICLIVSYIGQYAEGQDINDWFRREHSLIKPFGGTLKDKQLFIRLLGAKIY